MLARCDCGITDLVNYGNLTRLKNPKCRKCARREAATTRACAQWGRPASPEDRVLYDRWIAIKDRCRNPKCRAFKHYGARGVRLAPEFERVVVFVDYVKALPGYSLDKSIDRIDVNGDYAPGNLRWATSQEQMRNTQKSYYVTYKGNTYNARDFAEQFTRRYLTQQVVRLAKLGLTGEQILERESNSHRAGLRHRKLRA